MQNSNKQTKQVEQALALLTTDESQQMVFNHFLTNMSRHQKAKVLMELYDDFFVNTIPEFSEVITLGSLLMLAGVSASDDLGGESLSIEFTSDIRNFFDTLGCFNLGVRDLKNLTNA